MKQILQTPGLRKIPRAAAFVALLAVAALLSQLSALAVSMKSDAQVKVSARATKPDAAGKQIVTITMDINEGWHIYANPVKSETLLGAQTVVNISGIKAEHIEVRYPSGKVKESSQLGKYVVYEGKVAIQALVQRNASESNGLEVNVRFMSCNEAKETCLLPADVKFKLP